jgi:hypothetical protein
MVTLGAISHFVITRRFSKTEFGQVEGWDEEDLPIQHVVTT